MSILIALLVIALLILLNGMFVAAEFAILGVRPTRIAQLAESGHHCCSPCAGHSRKSGPDRSLYCLCPAWHYACQSGTGDVR